MRLLVVGAQPESLGEAVKYEAVRLGVQVVTAGVDPASDHPLDIRDSGAVLGLMHEVKPDSIVCTAGINRSVSVRDADWQATFLEHMTLTAGIGMLLRAWLNCPLPDSAPQHFVAISSNSAHIARTNSSPYCASKAALSMLLRVAAREEAGYERVIYGYEPGWIDGTPMSQVVSARFPNQPLHRIPGGYGLQSAELATMIVNNIREGVDSLNGCMLRVDGGEQ